MRAAEARFAWVVPALALTFVGVVVVLPGAALVLGILGDVRGTFTALTGHEFVAALSRTLALTATTLVLDTVLGIATALVLVRDRFVGKRVLAWLIDLPLAVSPVMVGLAFLLLFGRHGWLEPVADALGLEVAFAFPGMLVVSLFVTVPFIARETALVLEAVGSEEEEAAITLGASAAQTFFWVTLPNVMPGVVGGAALVIARSLGEFGAVLVVGGAISGLTDTATTLVYDALEERRLATAYGASLLLVALSIAALDALVGLQKRVHA